MKKLKTLLLLLLVGTVIYSPATFANDAGLSPLASKLDCRLLDPSNTLLWKFSQNTPDSTVDIQKCVDDSCDDAYKIQIFSLPRPDWGDQESDYLQVRCKSCKKGSEFKGGWLQLAAGTFSESSGRFNGIFFEGNNELQAICQFAPKADAEDAQPVVAETVRPSVIKVPRSEIPAEEPKVAVSREKQPEPQVKSEEKVVEEETPAVQAEETPVVEEEAKVADSKVVCVGGGNLSVRDSSLEDVLFYAHRGDEIVVNEKQKKTSVIDGTKYSFVQVKFVAKKKIGWIAAKYVKTKEECGISSAVATKKPVPKKQVEEKPKAEPVKVPAPVVEKPKAEPKVVVNQEITDQPNCAEKKILAAAKKNVANRWDNNSTGTGMCALGVRQSLQASGVGSINGGLGNAVDQVAALEKHGYIDSGIKDIAKAPPGAVIIFKGPNTDTYFKTGHYGSPAGNWVGHVTIKGDDGFYYTDGRTRQPAMGWNGTRNVSKIRNVMAIMVPGPTLVTQYADQCVSKR